MSKTLYHTFPSCFILSLSLSPSLQLLPLVTVENDDEIGRLVKVVCSRVAHTELSPEAVPQAIAALEEVRGYVNVAS
jgi:hypothetical protein